MKKNLIHPFDFAQTLIEFPLPQQALMFQELEFETMVEVFEYLSVHRQSELLTTLDDNLLNQIFEELDYDSIDNLIQDDPELLKRLNTNNKGLVSELHQYPVDSAGRLMLTETFTVSIDETILEVIARIKGENDLYYQTILFVLNHQQLVGYIKVTDLLKFDDSTTITSILKPIQHFAYAKQDQEEVMHIFSNYDLEILAVVDENMNYLGVITVDYIVDVMQDELDEDITKMGAISPLDDSYLETSVFEHVKKRFVWLLVLMISATITGLLLVKYEHAFEALPALVAFIPMLMDTSGNAGSQASTLVIRGIATHEIDLKDAWKVLSKEVKIALIVAILLSAVNFVRIILMGQSWQISLVVSLTLIVTIIASKLIGALLPLIADRLKLDPAVMSAPLITTIVDTISIMVYFNIAMLILNI